MVFTKDGLLRLLVTAVISTVICLFINIVFINESIVAGMIIKSVLLGGSIWFVSELAFDFADRLWPHNIIPSYIILCLIIILGTTVGLLIFGIDSIGMILLIDILAVFCGLAMACFNRKRYKEKLNKRLEEFKEKSN